MFFWRLKNKNLILLLVFSFSFFSTLSPLFAKGRQDDVFGEVDRLIAAKNYDEAIDRLVKIVRENPALFDKVQSRLQNIVRSSNRYTEIATQLLDTIEQDPNNTDRIFELSQALDEQGEARTEEARKFIQEIQEVARYSVFRNQLEGILVEGRRLLDAGQYIEAYNRYLSGFSLYQSVFTGSDYPASVKSSVNVTNGSISAAAASLAQLSPRITSIVTELAALPPVSGNSRGQLLIITQSLDRIRGELDDLVQLKSVLWNARDDYRRFGTLDFQSEGRHYITFCNLLINGRPDQDVREGLLGAIDGLWQSITGLLEKPAGAAADGAFRDVLSSAYSRNYTQTRNLIAETNAALRGPLDLLAMYTRFTVQDDLSEHTVFGRRVRATDVEIYALIESLNRVLPLLSQALDYAESSDAANREMLTSTTLADYRSRRIDATRAIQREIDIRRSLLGIETGIRSLIVSFEQYLDELRPLNALNGAVSRGVDFFRDGLTFTGSIDTDLSTVKIASATRQYTVENEEYAIFYPLRVSQFDTNLTLINGVDKTLDGNITYLSKDPLRASLDLNTLNGLLAADISRGYALLNRYDSDTEVVSAEELIRLRAEATNQLARYEALYSRGTALFADARRTVAEAEALRTEGSRLYRNAETALNRSEFDAAVDYLNRSAAQYEASLGIQDSDAIRTESRERSLQLSAEIMRQRREFVRREVAELVRRAQPEFYANNHEIAEQLLVRAQTLHTTISEEEEPDVRYWLTIVRNALSFRSGRTIPFTAPLYPEMSQLLSSAEMEYIEGMSLLGSRRTEALEYFAGARQKVQEVKLLFPLNQEANLLELRMDQVLDPAAFNASFQSRLQLAVAGTKSANIQAFADLQDLAMINPNYRGMPQIIYQAEVDMGMRPPPPDEVAIARSRDLIRSAQNLIAGGARSNMEVAQQQLIEALRVTPDNVVAQAELDRVERLMGRRAATELEAAIDNDYQEALRELLAGNKLIAYSIVQRVLARSEYRNSGRFRELLQRIESVL
jgi:hypothetical protein